MSDNRRWGLLLKILIKIIYKKDTNDWGLLEDVENLAVMCGHTLHGLARECKR